MAMVVVFDCCFLFFLCFVLCFLLCLLEFERWAGVGVGVDSKASRIYLWYLTCRAQCWA